MHLQVEPREAPEKVATGSSVATTSTTIGIPNHRRVLVDTGAHELMQPLPQSWWHDLMRVRHNGNTLTMQTRGSAEVPGAMASFSNVLMNYTCKKNCTDIACIPPPAATHLASNIASLAPSAARC